MNYNDQIQLLKAIDNAVNETLAGAFYVGNIGRQELKTLSKRDLVEYSSDSSDGINQYLELTALGQDTLDAAMACERRS